MVSLSLPSFLQRIVTTFDLADGATVSELVSFNDSHVINPRLKVDNPENIVSRFMDKPLDDMISAHLRCLSALIDLNYVEAIRWQTVVVQSFAKILQTQKETNWALPVMYTVCRDLRRIAGTADSKLKKDGSSKSGEHLEKAADTILSCFRICAADNRAADEDTKRFGMMYLVNQLLKIYFRLGKLHLVKPLIRAIDSSQFKDRFPLAQQITYKFYVGRKAMFDSDYRLAAEHLEFAFIHCHKACRRNKRLILIYLIPVKMLLGNMPSEELLQKYELKEFCDLVKAVRQGDLRSFDKALSEGETFFIKSGIYLILETLRVITYRNLFKKVWLLLRTHQLSLGAFQAALRWLGADDIDMEETQCILANLIYENRIKGYISLQHLKLVVSKQNPFPAISTTA